MSPIFVVVIFAAVYLPVNTKLLVLIVLYGSIVTVCRMVIDLAVVLFAVALIVLRLILFYSVLVVGAVVVAVILVGVVIVAVVGFRFMFVVHAGVLAFIKVATVNFVSKG